MLKGVNVFADLPKKTAPTKDKRKKMKKDMDDNCSPSMHTPTAMKIVAWNCQGLGNPHVVQSLKFLKQQQNPDIIFLCETKFDESALNNIKLLLGFYFFYCVNCDGRKGGLGLFWYKNIDINILSASKYCIDP